MKVSRLTGVKCNRKTAKNQRKKIKKIQQKKMALNSVCLRFDGENILCEN
jgi:hypothetical protein